MRGFALALLAGTASLLPLNAKAGCSSCGGYVAPGYYPAPQSYILTWTAVRVYPTYAPPPLDCDGYLVNQGQFITHEALIPRRACLSGCAPAADCCPPHY